jgi:hypothetical protein
MATIQDQLDSIAADGVAVAADQAALTTAQAQQTVDDTSFVTALTTAGITEFGVPSADGSSVAVYTLSAPGTSPPYTEVVIPTAASITLPTPTTPAVVAPAVVAAAKKAAACRR